MNAKLKGLLHAVVNIGGNGLIFELVPSPYKAYCFVAFNVIQVVYAYFDPTYAVHLLGEKDKQTQ